MKRVLLSAAASIAAIATAGTGTAFAQNVVDAQDADGVPDIVVTATRMGETQLQSTPIAVTALGGDQLDARGVRDVQDLKAYVPSLQVSDLSGYTQLFIRGIGSNIVFIGSDPSTTIHSDGIYLARPLSYLTDFLDVERVEVLRGPQGTLYGRNSVGGTINVVSRKPSDTLQAQAQFGYGSYDRYAAQGYVSGPIAGGVRASLAVDVSGHDAFRKNISTGNDAEDLKSRGVRGQLLIPVGDGEWTIRADWSRQSGAFGAYPKLIRPTGNPFDDAILGDFDKVSMNRDNFTVLKNYGAASDLVLPLTDSIKLRSLTGYRAFRGSIETDADASSIDILRNLISPIRQHQFSQEFTLLGDTGPLEWVLGAYYFNERNREPLTLALFPFGASHIQRPLLKARSIAGFAQGEYKLSDQLSFIAGLRYTRERKAYAISDYFTASTDLDPAVAEKGFVLAGIPGLPDPFTVDARRHDDAFTPKFGITFKPTEQVLLYASATRGFKSGGFDYGSSNAADAAAGYGPEKLWSYELGLKSDWLDRRLRVNLTGFYYDYTDLQVQSYVQIGASFGARTQNAATARVKGLEAEIVARPVRALELSANVAWLDAEYRRYPNAFVSSFGAFDASGKRLNNAPRWSATFGAAYSFDLAGSGKLTLGADAHVQSSIYFTAANDGVGAVSGYAEQQKGYGIVNARIGWTSPDDRWKAQLIASNLFDKDYIVGTANYTAAIAARQGRPREVLVQIGYAFR
ncbi:TonB-dependent receptor [Rhizorhabdus wittichii RW1]|uniref:TonB-dependent receptor n=1 Tax=Rhizorhabdus wittichii (strain DSM 6014 / CCUG 31198 / JCM 15750 / NBRC 105917 / EY 4224 / RW1) TaxID=392499 RepID=A0A9J9HDX9_RHIWR|nr:TonB-dependent receptor [Rhizorhabdus wittichii RW1]